MIIGLSMPGGSEWLIVLVGIMFVIVMPILAIIYYFKYKQLQKEFDKVSAERKDLLKRLLDKSS